MVQKYPSMNSTFFVNEWNGKSILGHMVQTNQLNDRKICMNCIINVIHVADDKSRIFRCWESCEQIQINSRFYTLELPSCCQICFFKAYFTYIIPYSSNCVQCLSVKGAVFMHASRYSTSLLHDDRRMNCLNSIKCQIFVEVVAPILPLTSPWCHCTENRWVRYG